ncbi:hypothetical protein EV363DRAFT_103201, partial [Boletus edulis]
QGARHRSKGTKAIQTTINQLTARHFLLHSKTGSIIVASVAMEEVVASSGETTVGTPVMYEASAHVPFVGLLITEVPSNPAVASAELGEGAITVGGDDCVGGLELIVDGPHESVSALESSDLGVAAMLERFWSPQPIEGVTVSLTSTSVTTLQASSDASAEPGEGSIIVASVAMEEVVASSGETTVGT